jgi:hypothetical protein
MFSLAATRGKFEILKFLRESGWAFKRNTFSEIALAGNLEIAKWAREEGCPWNEDACASATRKNNFEMLKWLRENGCPWNENTCTAAATTGNFDRLIWLITNGCPFLHSVYKTAKKSAAQCGNLEMLKWAHENDSTWDMAILSTAIFGNHVAVLEWMIEHGAPCEPITIFDLAVQHGRPVVLSWAMKKFPTKIEDLTSLANLCTKNFHNPGISLTWLLSSGIPFPDDFYDTLLQSSNKRAKIWLVKRRIPDKAQGAWREAEELLLGAADANVNLVLTGEMSVKKMLELCRSMEAGSW